MLRRTMGNVLALVAPYSQLSQQWPPASTFEPKRDIPDMTGKVVIVTGANSGVGYHTAKELLRKNAAVYFACRDVKKTKEAIGRIETELRDETPELPAKGFGRGIVLQLDLSDLASVKRAATEILSKEERVDILVNNAGVMLVPFDLLTEQGYDLQFGTNVLGHYYFTILLLPALERSTKHHNEKARVINVSSGTHIFSPGKTGINWQVLQRGPERDQSIDKLGFGSDWKLYGISKMGNILMSNFLARHYSDKIVSCSLNPGIIKTSLLRHISPTYRTLVRVVLHHAPASIGAYTSLFAATVVPADEINGNFYQPWARFGKADSRANSVEVQDQLEEWLQKQIAVFEMTQSTTS